MTAKSKSINISAATLEPILDRVVVKRDLAQEKTYGGVELPDSAQRLSHLGTVLAVGPGMLRATQAFYEDSPPSDRHPMQCCVGDRVLLPSHILEVQLDPDDPQSKVIILQESQLQAILR